MTFYDRYAELMEKRGIKPSSQQAADVFGLTRSTISAWNAKNMIPKGKQLAQIADFLNTSVDYLLGRTDDPTDFTYTYKADEPNKVVSLSEKRKTPVICELYNMLDNVDKIKAEGFLRGMLMAEKYSDPQLLNAAHSRTDIAQDPELIAHDEKIMDDENF